MAPKVVPFHHKAAKSPLRHHILLDPLRKELAQSDPIPSEDKSPRALLAPVPGIGNYHYWSFEHGTFCFLQRKYNRKKVGNSKMKNVSELKVMLEGLRFAPWPRSSPHSPRFA
jgi:hypothetical protein